MRKLQMNRNLQGAASRIPWRLCSVFGVCGLAGAMQNVFQFLDVVADLLQVASALAWAVAHLF